MSIYELVQLFLAGAVLIVALLTRNNRAAWWIVAIVIDLVISTWAWTSGHQYAAAVTAGADFTLCLAIYLFGAQRWEMWLFLLYQFSMLTSIAYLGTMIWSASFIDHDAYSSVLEAVNYSALLVIAITSGMSLASTHRDSSAYRPWRWLRPAGFPLSR